MYSRFPSHLRMRPLSTSSVFCNDLVNRLSSLLRILLLGEQGIDIYIFFFRFSICSFVSEYKILNEEK
ncbi:hypothetical protein RHGRI_026034 [Rhododendron griersonianum]|uniref:Uncharacterized protein n=1 Tax=Rhododendron griersonianum TaxID=479676 RepID=A0AAV6IRD8_9ERIC|nr:hypothetical protein RHGRI_026034 [Rhododendron griersonianum]